MKKSIKALIVAASVAAVAGIGAVSFAKWEAGNAATKTATGNTGSINTIGTLTVTPTSASGSVADTITMNALYPVDQGGTYLTYWEFDIEVTGEGEQTLTVQATYSAGTSGKAQGTGVIYYAKSAPQGATVAGAQDISSAQTVDLQKGDNKYTAKVYIYFTNTAETLDMMGGSITVTFTASAKTTA
ncbi:MAG: hypothetical protein J1G01_03880 [Clostridiales bacterium]|nr:hypothetical protein [Clostridiales bacterium]